MRVLVLGGGGREHALVWKIAQSPLLTGLLALPGSDAIAAHAKCLAGDPCDIDTVLGVVEAHKIDLVVVGPEAPLVAGVSDALTGRGIAVFGPSKAAAQLESSKGYTKRICETADIPTGQAVQADTFDAALAALDRFSLPVVLKADGLAAGKGVVIAETRADAETAARDLLSAYGPPLLVEEFLVGDEISFFALSDGTNILPLASAEDHKAAYDGDRGPNTGGMGAFSPSALMTDALQADVMARIIRPTVAAMHAAGTPFKGVLYAGLMLTKDGPKLLEYNARFGDPECQILMLRMESDILPLLMAVAEGRLDDCTPPSWSSGAAATIVMAAKGYPGAYEKGAPITGLDRARAAGATIFEAGTKHTDGTVRAAGGRVLNVCATGQNRTDAVTAAYAGVAHIDWPGGFYRRDIGQRTYKTR